MDGKSEIDRSVNAHDVLEISTNPQHSVFSIGFIVKSIVLIIGNMKPILYSLVLFLGLVASSLAARPFYAWTNSPSANPLPTVQLAAAGQLSGNYTLVGTSSSSPYGITWSFVDNSSPQSPYGFGSMHSLTLLDLGNNQFEVLSIEVREAPWSSKNYTFDIDGSILQQSGSVAGYNNIDFSAFAGSWQGGGWGPGYVLGGDPPTVAAAQELVKGLSFQNGEWTPE